jgi:molecular chaperone GrpE (heat shock protein)
MIIGLDKMESSLLMLTNDLDNIALKYLDKIPTDERKDFRCGIESVRNEMFKMLEASKKVKELVARVY